MKLTLLAKEEPYEFRWWNGTVEPYDTCIRYNVEDPPGGTRGGELSVAIGFRAAYGANRRRILAFRDAQHVLLELVGTDDWSESRHVAWAIKRPGGHRGAARIEDVPPEFRAFDVDRFNTWVTGPSTRHGYAVRLREDDHTSIVTLALYREVQKSQKTPPSDATEAILTDETVIEDDAAVLPEVVVPTSNQLFRTISGYAREFLDEHLFPTVERCTQASVTSRESALTAMTNPVVSLRVLLGGYAFARQGSERAGYNEVCILLLAPYIGAEPDTFWHDYADWQSFYDAFVSQCEQRRIKPNEKFNRGLIRDVYSLASNDRSLGLYHRWANAIRQTGRIKGVFDQLQDVHGIGNKIAAFICRDLVFLTGLEDSLPLDERRYLQPIDIWVGRFAEYANPALTFGRDPWWRIADYLVHACADAGVSGVSLNQGAWYFGSQVAGTAAALERLLDEIEGESGPKRGRDRRSNRLVVVPCGKRKVWDDDPNRGECPAKDAYTGSFFTVNRKYAERFASDDWVILSARFGFLRPDTPITNYNATFKDGSDGVITPDQLRVSAIEGGIHEYGQVEILGGAAYVERVRDALSGYPVAVLAPYEGCGGIGQMMGKATEAIEAGKPM